MRRYIVIGLVGSVLFVIVVEAREPEIKLNLEHGPELVSRPSLEPYQAAHSSGVGVLRHAAQVEPWMVAAADLAQWRCIESATGRIWG